MQKRKLPIGIQTFKKIHDEGCYYVDKTMFIHRLIESGSYYFLSRPRRFGKSLLLDTLKEVFEGHQALFKGLFIEDKWDWNKTYPVIRLNFGDGTLKNRAELDVRIQSILRVNCETMGLTLQHQDDVVGQFSQLIRDAHKKFNAPVVILIDEYDKPILDNITDASTATDMREGLKNLYSVIKGADAHIKFCFLTGVSKFSKVSLFSGLNNLHDITLLPEYSSICGYTDQDLDTVFAPELVGLNREDIRRWYNGYNWLGESVYNPFDVLLYFRERELKAHWFETGSSTFLIKMLREREFFTPDLAKMQTDFELLGQFDVDYIALEALLFQTGYLTIKSKQELIPGKTLYQLGYPNLEVETALNSALLPFLGINRAFVLNHFARIINDLKTLNFDDLALYLKSLYASIPHAWYRKNTLANYEGHYASIFYSHFAALGLQVTKEDSNNNGQVDMTIEFNNTTFIFEFKVVPNQATGAALQQIKTKQYADQYRGRGHPIYLIGVEFSTKQRQIVTMEAELAV